MNVQGKEYVEAVNKEFKLLPPQARSLFNVSREQMVERLMRLGTEVRVYELLDSEHEIVADATLKEDFIRSLSEAFDVLSANRHKS